MDVTILRHAESTVNASGNFEARNASLSPQGVETARGLTGYYDVVLCSPLRSARQTLELSRISFAELVIVPEAREIICCLCDVMSEDEDDECPESDEAALRRCVSLYNRIKVLYKPGMSILLISHCLFIAEFTNAFSKTSLNLQNAELVSVTLVNKSN